jgi:hypothetical protein
MLSGKEGATLAALLITEGAPSEKVRYGRKMTGRQAQTEGYDGVFSLEFVL